MTFRKSVACSVILGLLLVAGCTPTTQVSADAKPEERLNPAISAQQKAVLLRHKQRNGDLDTQ